MAKNCGNLNGNLVDGILIAKNGFRKQNHEKILDRKRMISDRK